MYETEYKWTKKDIVVTTTNIRAVTLSNKKAQVTFSKSTSNQVNSSNDTKPPDNPISKSKNQDTNVVNNKEKTAKMEEPSRPSHLPKKLIKKNEKRGKYKTIKYITEISSYHLIYKCLKEPEMIYQTF